MTTITMTATTAATMPPTMAPEEPLELDSVFALVVKSVLGVDDEMKVVGVEMLADDEAKTDVLASVVSVVELEAWLWWLWLSLLRLIL